MRTLTMLLTAVLAWPAATRAEDHGLFLGPALVLIQDIPPGRDFTLGAAGGQRFRVSNRTPDAGSFGAYTCVPNVYGFTSFERGYEPAPDATWFGVEPSLLELGPHGVGQVDLRVRIPDRPEHYNRHWVVYLETGAPPGSTGAVLRMRARILLETTVRPAESGQAPAGGEIALAPATLTLARVGDGPWQGRVAVANHTSQEATFDLLRFTDLYPGQTADRGPRFFADFQHAVLDERWASADAESFTLGPESWRELVFSAGTERPVAAGGRREELIFVARRLATGSDATKAQAVGERRYERIELLRLVYAVPAGKGP